MKMKLIALAALTAQVQSVTIHPLYEWPVYKTPGSHFPSAYDEFPGTQEGAPKYDREMPDNFDDLHKDDMFMNSMISSYAKEGRDKNGQKNGKFYLDHDSGEEAAKEILHTHLGLSGKALDNYMMENYDIAWKYYDVNDENLIEADRMTTFFRYLCKDANLNI